MSHTTVDEEAAGRAALYALGALEGDEAREFEEHLAAGCAACEAELRGFETVAADPKPPATASNSRSPAAHASQPVSRCSSNSRASSPSSAPRA